MIPSGSTCVKAWYRQKEVSKIQRTHREPFGCEFIRWLMIGVEANFRSGSEGPVQIWNPYTREKEVVPCAKYKLTLESRKLFLSYRKIDNDSCSFLPELIAKYFSAFKEEFNAPIELVSKANEVINVEVLGLPELLPKLEKHCGNGSPFPAKDSRHKFILAYRANSSKWENPVEIIFTIERIEQI